MKHFPQGCGRSSKARQGGSCIMGHVHTRQHNTEPLAAAERCAPMAFARTSTTNGNQRHWRQVDAVNASWQYSQHCYCSRCLDGAKAPDCIPCAPAFAKVHGGHVDASRFAAERARRLSNAINRSCLILFAHGRNTETNILARMSGKRSDC